MEGMNVYPLKKDRIKTLDSSAVRKHRIIKYNDYSVDGSTIIEMEGDCSNSARRTGRIEPMIKDGQIVGVMHECACGKVTIIQFEYDS